MKKFFGKLHLWLSIPTGIIITLTCFSGAMLIFEDEITEWQYSSIYNVKNYNELTLPLDTLLSKALNDLPEETEITQLTISNDPNKSFRIGLDSGDAYFINQYTGKVLGKEPETPKFFISMYRLHRFLLQKRPEGDSIFWGKTIVGISTIILIIILISGIIVWLPKSLKNFRKYFKINISKGWVRFWYDLHVSAGIYAVLLILIMGLTGLTWSFGWYRDIFYKIFSSDQNPPTITLPNIENNNEEDNKPLFTVWQNIYEKINRLDKGYVKLNFSKDEVKASISNSGNISAADYYEFDSNTGKITNIILYQNSSYDRKTRGWIYSLHTGNWGGIAMRIVYFIAALIGASLPITGYYIWIRRLYNKKNRHNI